MEAIRLQHCRCKRGDLKVAATRDGDDDLRGARGTANALCRFATYIFRHDGWPMPAGRHTRVLP